jgi:hypothetical protein
VGGVRLQARRWLLAAGSADSALDESIAVYNTGTSAVNLSVSSLDGAMDDVGGLAGLALPPGRRLVVRLNDHSPTLARALVVEASGNVIVERDISRVKGVGIDATIGVPLDAP